MEIGMRSVGAPEDCLQSVFSWEENWSLPSSGHQKRRPPVTEKVAGFELSQRVLLA